MDILLNIVSLVGPVILAFYINSMQSISIQIRIILWIVCAAIIIFDLYLIIKDRKDKGERIKRETMYNRLFEKLELFERQLPEILLDSTKRNPSINKMFADARRQEGHYNFKQAIETYKQCLKQSKNSKTDMATLNIFIGQCYFFLSQSKTAEKYFREAMEQGKDIEDERLKTLVAAYLLGKIGNIYHHLGKPDDALSYYQRALEFNRKLGYGNGEAQNLRNIGTVYGEINERNKALQYQEDALDIDKKMNNQEGIAICLTNIGSAYHDFEQYDDAEKFYLEALDIFQKKENLEGIANIYNLKGLNQNSRGNTEQAINQYKEALKINRKLKYCEGVTTNLGNIGLAYITLGESQKALKYYNEAIELFEQMDAQPRKEILMKIINVMQDEKMKKRSKPVQL